MPPPSFNELPDAPSFDDLPDAGGTGAPGVDSPAIPEAGAPEGMPQGPMGKVLNFTRKAITEDVPQGLREGASALAAPFKALGAIPGLINRAMQISGELGKSNPQGGIQNDIIGLQLALQEAIPQLSPEEKKALITKMSSSAAGAIGGGLVGGPLGAYAGGIAGYKAGQEGSEALGFEPDTPAFSEKKMHELIQVALGDVFTMGMGKYGGKYVSKAGEFARETLGNIEKMRDIARLQPDRIPALLTVGARQNATTTALLKELREGREVFANVYLDEMKGAKNAVGAKELLDKAISARREAKESIFDSLNSKYKAAEGADRDAFLFSAEDVGINKIQKKIAELKETGIGSEAAGLQNKILDDAASPFSREVPIIAGGKEYGMSQSVPVKKTFAEMQRMLDATYDELAELKHFDYSAAGKAGADPSVLAQAKAATTVYADLAANIRSAMTSKMEALAKRGLVAEGTATKFSKLNDEMHKLMPYRTAFDNLIKTAEQTGIPNIPRTLAPNAGSPFGRSGSNMVQAVDVLAAPVTKSILERQALSAGNNFEPNVLSDLQKTSELVAGRRDPASGVSGLGTFFTQGAGMGAQATGATMQAMGQAPVAAAAIAAQQSNVLDPDNYDNLMANPDFLPLLQQDPDIPDETKTLVQQARNGTQYEKLKALGQLKIDARDKGWFPPPPMVGIHSYAALPKTEYRGQKVLGTITDQGESHIFLDALDRIPDVAKRTKLKSAFNSPGHYVLEIPNSLKPVPLPEKPAPEKKEPVLEEPTSTAKISDGGAGIMERVMHDN